MIFLTSQITSMIHDDFMKQYKSFSEFSSSGKLWDDCIAATQDSDLMNNIIFCNDVHEIPPALSFLRALNPREDLEEFERRAVGAFWGFIFKFVFGYRNQRSVSTQRCLLAREKKIIKSATYFYDIDEKVVVVKAPLSI